VCEGVRGEREVWRGVFVGGCVCVGGEGELKKEKKKAKSIAMIDDR